MKAFRYAEILETLDRFDPWLGKLGIEPKQDRIHQVIAMVRVAEEGFRRLRETGQLQKIGNAEDYYFGINEALEFHGILQAFENEEPKNIAPKMRVALSGPLRPTQERPETAHGRNTMFELALGADWRLRGAEVTIEEPDLRIDLGGTPFLVACKRPYRETGIRANVRDAADQLAGHLNRKDYEQHRGIVALSVSRILNPGDKIFQAPNEAGQHRLGDIVERLLRDNERHWNRYQMTPRLVGILFQATTPAVIKETDTITQMSYSVVMTVGNDKQGHELIERRLKPLFKD